MKTFLVLLLLAGSALSAQAKESKKYRVPIPRCDEFVGYSLGARVRYEISHPRLPLVHRISHDTSVVCLRGELA